jgi:glucose-6-phosphate isomerase
MSLDHLRLDLTGIKQFVRDEEMAQMEPQVVAAFKLLQSRKGPGNDFLGWLDQPIKYDKAEYRRIKAAAKRIQKQAEVLIVIGIGGSYLGAKAAIDFCSHTFYNNQTRKSRKTPEIYFAGTNLSSAYLHDLIELIGDRNWAINVISKSGTTTEPAIAFRVLKAALEAKYGAEEARNRIYATTDQAKGALKQLATNQGYKTFIVPDDIGGRFSVLTAVGLLPIAVAGIDTDALLLGAADARKHYLSATYQQSDALQYVAARNALLRKGKSIEILANYEPRLNHIAEWWKQLFGESEGKDGKGIFTASVSFTSDLHSLGQFIQDGSRNLFETVIHIDHASKAIKIPTTTDNLDGLNYLSGRTLDDINQKAAQGTRMAHIDGGVPNLSIHLADHGPKTLGALFYFFEITCAISGYVLGVNPFDQPGVEAYKKNMFALLKL